jgi:hypothetical protein
MISGILIRNRADTVNNTFPFDDSERVENVVVRALQAYYLRPLRSVSITALEERDNHIAFRAVIFCQNDDVLHETGKAYLTTYFYREYDTRELRLHVGMTVYLDETPEDEETKVWSTDPQGLPKPTKTLDLSQMGPTPTE